MIYSFNIKATVRALVDSISIVSQLACGGGLGRTGTSPHKNSARRVIKTHPF